jgi:PAS domain S-box-containing protein
MESLERESAADVATSRDLHAMLARWTSEARVRLRVGGEWSVATALREGIELADEELRAESESLRADRGRSEERLARLACLMELAPVGLLVTTEDGRVREVNAEAERLVGIAGSQLVGRSFVRYVAVNDRAFFRRLIGELATGVGVRAFPLRLHAPRGGGEHDVLARVRSHRGAGEERTLYWALSDDARRSEEDLL